MNLKQEISKNIQLVFDNEKSFINTFFKSSLKDVTVDYFYMGSSQHLAKFSFDYDDQGFSREFVISIGEFDNWKYIIDNKEGK